MVETSMSYTPPAMAAVCWRPLFPRSCGKLCLRWHTCGGSKIGVEWRDVADVAALEQKKKLMEKSDGSEIRRTHLKDRVLAPSQVVFSPDFWTIKSIKSILPCFQGGAWHWAPGRHNPSFWLMKIFWVLETLVGGFIFFKNFHPYLGKCSNLTDNFSNGLKPPTRKHLFGFLSSIRLPHFLDFFSGASSGETRKSASLWHFRCHKPSAGHAESYL